QPARGGTWAGPSAARRTAPRAAPPPPMESMTDTTTEVNVVKAPALGPPDDDDELTRRPAPIPKAVQESFEAALPPPPMYSANTGTNMLALPLGGGDEPGGPPEFPREPPARFSKDADTGQPFAPIGAAPPVPAPPPRDP